MVECLNSDTFPEESLKSELHGVIQLLVVFFDAVDWWENGIHPVETCVIPRRYVLEQNWAESSHSRSHWVSC